MPLHSHAPMWISRCALLGAALGGLLSVAFGAQQAQAHKEARHGQGQAGEQLGRDDQLFPRPPFVRKQVRFWEKIFYKYPSTTVVVHETNDPDRIVDVIDYQSSRRTAGGIVPRKEREQVSSLYLKRYLRALDRFAKEGRHALRYGAIEKRLYEVFKSNPANLKRLYSGTIRLRVQTGLADDFLAAASTAQAYLPYMEKVFHQFGAPSQLTRLAFVESMFNVKAISKVGASGIWQFMPATARRFIFVNQLVDERNSPFKETRAAAQLLLDNFRELGSWPLAVTAYNHGKLGMERAMKKVASQDLDQIIRRYESPSFGFASANFYAEFLAAANTYDRLYRQGKVRPGPALAETEAVILNQPLSLREVVRMAGVDGESLARHNPCLLPTTLTINADKALPNYYELRLPKAAARSLRLALLKTPKSRYARK